MIVQRVLNSFQKSCITHY